MDYTLIALIGLVVLVIAMSTRYHSRTWSGRPGYQYQRVITVGVLGLWLAVTGAVGRGVVRGSGHEAHRIDGPMWWQIGAGVALLAFAVILARRLPRDATRSRVP